MRLGDLEFLVLTDGTLRLDGGAMFGVVPKPMWEKKSRADERNRILLSMNCLLIRAGGKRFLSKAARATNGMPRSATFTRSMVCPGCRNK